jgi:shikimate kinase
MNMMKEPRSNIVLIGMPGSGKSTVGVILAKMTSRDFVDTDLTIQTLQNRPLQDIVDSDGYDTLRKIEGDVLMGLSVQNHVIATGGSAVYSHESMLHLKSNSVVIFLDVSIDTLKSRVSDFGTRGLAKPPEQSFSDLFNERFALYTKYADITIKCDGLNQEDACNRIIEITEYS